MLLTTCSIVFLALLPAKLPHGVKFIPQGRIIFNTLVSYFQAVGRFGTAGKADSSGGGVIF
jgi:hypothetical protein